jgi:uncharacterized membrane protein YgdD (TMEM256/DUF423 family)
MKERSYEKKMITLGIILCGFSVIFGAFVTHGLKNFITLEKIATFETGVRYQMYHSLGLILLGILQTVYSSLNLKAAMRSFILGISFFSMNCYIYALSDIKFFALIVPVGGTAFIIGWILAALEMRKL